MTKFVVGPCVLTLLVPATGSCGGAAQSSSSNDVAFKSASVDNAAVGAGVTNVLAVSFMAPESGFVWASATGTCGVIQPLPVSSVLSAQIETSPTLRDPNPGDGAFDRSGGGATGPDMGSFDAARALAVTVGHNSIYLNINNPSAGGALDCSAAMLVVFSNQQLR